MVSSTSTRRAYGTELFLLLTLLSATAISAQQQCTNETFPFTFFDAGGNVVAGEQLSSGDCIYPASACGPESESVGCCEPNSVKTGTNYMYIAWALILVPSSVLIPRYFEEIKSRNPEKLEGMQSGGAVPSWIENSFLRIFASLWNQGIWFGLFVKMVTPVVMKQSIQASLTVSSRTVLQSAEAFLVPYQEIFLFVEDIVSVKLNYALASGEKSRADMLVHIGLAASIISGLTASLIAAVLGVFPKVLAALTNPGLDNDLSIYPGCNIIEATRDAKALIVPYWQIEVWKFLGWQVSSVLAGFFFGALEFNTYGWIMAVGVAVLPLVWFTNISKPIEPLLLLALGDFAVPYVLFVLSVLYLVTPLGKTIRENTGVSLSFMKLLKSFGNLKAGLNDDTTDKHEEKASMPAVSGESQLTTSLLQDTAAEEGIEAGATSQRLREGQQSGEEEPESISSTGSIIREGLCIMAMDVGVQVAKSLANYLALLTDAATAYQITALDSYLPTYGFVYAAGMAFMIKITGPIFLSMQEYSLFFRFIRDMFIAAFLLVPLIVGSTIPFYNGLALETGQNACTFASSEECVKFFSNVFGTNGNGGTFTLPFTFMAFAYGACIDSLFQVSRAAIVTMLDFQYIVKSTGVAIIFYVIAIVVASVVKPFARQAIAYFIAMYVPQVVLIILFMGRTHTLFRRMVRGEVKGAMRERLKKKVFRANSVN